MTGKKASEILGLSKATVNSLDEWLGTLLKRVGELEQLVKTQQEEIKRLKGDPKKIDDWVTVTKKKLPEHQLKVMNAVTIEQQKKKKKEKNVMIFGVKESTAENDEEKKSEDLKIVKEIFDEIGASSVPVYVKRFKKRKDGKKENSVGPILVELSDAAERNPILAASKKLKNIEKFKKVYLSPDMTEAERLLNFELRTERNKKNKELDSDSPFYFGIRGSEIVKLKKKN